MDSLKEDHKEIDAEQRHPNWKNRLNKDRDRFKGNLLNFNITHQNYQNTGLTN